MAYVVGAGINFTGFLDNMGAIKASTGVERSFYFAFITTGVASGLTYYLLARFVPQKNYLVNKGKRFEEWSQEHVERYAAGHQCDNDSEERDEEKTGSTGDEKVLEQAIVTVLIV